MSAAAILTTRNGSICDAVRGSRGAETPKTRYFGQECENRPAQIFTRKTARTPIMARLLTYISLVMACIVMAYMFVAYIVMASDGEPRDLGVRCHCGEHFHYRCEPPSLEVTEGSKAC